MSLWAPDDPNVPQYEGGRGPKVNRYGKAIGPRPDLTGMTPEQAEDAIWKYKAQLLPDKSEDIAEMFESMPLTNLLNDGDKLTGEAKSDFEAMQSLIDETPEEDRADTFKKTGNELLEFARRSKKNRYRALDAIIYYTKGLELNCRDQELNSILYANRAAANLFVENYQKCAYDCLWALKCDRTNLKACIRGARACVSMENFKKAKEFVDIGMSVCGELAKSYQESGGSEHNEEDKTATSDHRSTQDTPKSGGGSESGEGKESSKKACKKALPPHLLFKPLLDKLSLSIETAREAAEKKRAERDKRIKLNELAKQVESKRLTSMLSSRQYRYAPPVIDYTQYPQPHPKAVLISNDSQQYALSWPLLVLYPEAKQSDYVAACMEGQSLKKILTPLLASPAPWDTNRQYHMRNIRVYYYPCQELSQKGGSQRQSNTSSAQNEVTMHRFLTPTQAKEQNIRPKYLSLARSLGDILGKSDFAIAGIPTLYISPSR